MLFETTTATPTVHQDATLLTLAWYLSGWASNLSLLQKQHLSVLPQRPALVHDPDQDLRRLGNTELSIGVDNQSSYVMCTHPTFRRTTRHIEMEFHCVQEQVEQGQDKLWEIKSAKTPVDHFTKPLAKGKLAQMCVVACNVVKSLSKIHRVPTHRLSRHDERGTPIQIALDTLFDDALVVVFKRITHCVPTQNWLIADLA
ncbi:hypothetical protein FI667_g3236, partial [Globisporangium splendens]